MANYNAYRQLQAGCLEDLKIHPRLCLAVPPRNTSSASSIWTCVPLNGWPDRSWDTVGRTHRHSQHPNPGHRQLDDLYRRCILIGNQFGRLHPSTANRNSCGPGRNRNPGGTGSGQNCVFPTCKASRASTRKIFLTMRLYTNNDAGNVLWEWAFEYVYVESTVIGRWNQADEVWYVTADNPVVELKAGVAGFAYP